MAIYFACKALNYRSFEDKYDGNRPLSVYVDWKIREGKLDGELCFDEPLSHGGTEIVEDLMECLDELDIQNTDDINDFNTWSDIVYEEE